MCMSVFIARAGGAGERRAVAEVALVGPVSAQGRALGRGCKGMRAGVWERVRVRMVGRGRRLCRLVGGLGKSERVLRVGGKACAWSREAIYPCGRRAMGALDHDGGVRWERAVELHLDGLGGRRCDRLGR